jgi:hypothetical protein
VASQRKKPPTGAKATYPGFIEPALATAIDKVPAGARWIHEIKFDGYRVQVHIRGGQSPGLHAPGQRLEQPLPQDRRRRL